MLFSRYSPAIPHTVLAFDYKLADGAHRVDLRSKRGQQEVAGMVPMSSEHCVSVAGQNLPGPAIDVWNSDFNTLAPAAPHRRDIVACTGSAQRGSDCRRTREYFVASCKFRCLVPGG